MFFRRKHRARKKIIKVVNPSITYQLFKMIAILMGVIFIHTIIIFYFESISLIDAVWLSFTSITTVGYGDYSAATLEGRIATIVLIYFIGIWILAQLAGDFLDYRAERRTKMAKGLWRWQHMNNHILIINTPQSNGERYLTRLVEQIRITPEIDTLPIQMVTRAYPSGLPNRLRELQVVHSHADISSKIDLSDLNIEQARFVIILSQDENDTRSDSLTLDLLDRIQAYQLRPFIVAECIQDDNRIRFQRLGACAVIRPVRAYPELIVRALSAPGTERVLENLFTHHGASTYRIDIDLSDIYWKTIVSRLIDKGLGTALGYISNTGTVITNPDYNDRISASALLVMVNDHTDISVNKIYEALA